MFLKRNKTSNKKRGRRLLIEALIFLLIFIGIKTWMKRDMVDGVPPPIQQADLSGQQVALADYSGKPVLVHFWASWCKVCDLERGAVDSVSKDWPVLSIAMQSGDEDAVSQFMDEKSISWRTISDESGALSSRYGIVGVPASFILNKDGEIVFSETGYTTSLGLRFRLWYADHFS